MINEFVEEGEWASRVHYVLGRPARPSCSHCGASVSHLLWRREVSGYPYFRYDQQHAALSLAVHDGFRLQLLLLYSVVDGDHPVPEDEDDARRIAAGVGSTPRDGLACCVPGDDVVRQLSLRGD